MKTKTKRADRCPDLNMAGKLQIVGIIGERILAGEARSEIDIDSVLATLAERYPDWETRFFLSEAEWFRRYASDPELN